MLLPALTPQIPQVQIVQQVKQEPKTVSVRDGDTLTSIAVAHGTSVAQIWAANTQLNNPDEIDTGSVLKLPEKGSTLPERPMPGKIEVSGARTLSSQVSAGGFSSSGNFDTTLGWCTNYAARRHPVPSWFGNADEWLYDANKAGMATGSTPRVGAIAQAASYMHVSIVEQIDGNRIYVSEQNYEGYGIVSSRWSDLSEWAGYIY